MEAIWSFWNWYLSLLIDPDSKVQIAAWSATVTTVGFLINFLFVPLWKLSQKKAAIVDVRISMKHWYYPTAFGLQTGPVMLECTVVNKDSKPIYIQRPNIKLSEKIDGKNTFVLIPLDFPQNFPLKLEYGQELVLNYDAVGLNEQLFSSRKERCKIKFTVNLTTGKTFSSNSMAIRDIIKHIQNHKDPSLARGLTS